MTHAHEVSDAEGLEEPGNYRFHTNKSGEICGMTICCPCGCGVVSAIDFSNVEVKGKDDQRWNWDGNKKRPTLTPSIHRTDGCEWHGYLMKGVFKEV